MGEAIGETAGRVWQYLHSNGPATASQIKKAVNADAALANQAVGWLAREGKIATDRSKRYVRFSLRE